MSLNIDSKLEQYKESLHLLRKDGIDKIRALKEELIDIKNDKNLEDDIKSTKLSDIKIELEKARKIEKENKERIKSLSRGSYS